MRTDLTDAEKNSARFAFTGVRAALVGRIAVVLRADSDDTVFLFWTNDSQNDEMWWPNSWVTVLAAADVAKQDVQFIAKLRAAAQRRHPDLAIVAGSETATAVQAAKRIKTAVGEIRIKLAAIEADVDKLPK